MIASSVKRFLVLLLPLILQVAASDIETVKVKVHAVTPRLCHLEEPHFEYEKQRLIFADQYGRRACSYDLKTGVTACTPLDQTLGAIVPVKNVTNQFLAVLGPYLVLLFWDGVSFASTYVVLARPEPEPEFPGNFFNDGKADSEGRLWVGTEGPALASGPAGRVPNRGNFYSYSTEKCGLVKKLSNVTLSNGLAWNKDNTILYYIDSGTYKVVSFDFDKKTGNISNRKTVFDFKANNITALLPHGMTIDTEDNLYVAMYQGFQIVKIDPRYGKLLLIIKLPISQVTDFAWGGPKLNVLYVTSSSKGLNETELRRQPFAGSVVAITGLNVTGRIANEAVICLPGQRKSTGMCNA